MRRAPVEVVEISPVRHEAVPFTDLNGGIKNTQSLAKWAALGREIRSADKKTVPNWLSVQKIIDMAEPVHQVNRNTARRLLEASNELFAPLKDPFEMRLGLHRWLGGEREEAYSDWLAWIIEQLATPDKIIPLLCGNNTADLVAGCAGSLSVQREAVFVTTETVRRTDIEICFGDTKAILVEIKLVDADKVAADQLYDQRYYGAHFLRRLLLCPSGEEESVPAGFNLVLWRDICLRLRRIAPSICQKNISIGAMILAFVGAVEQNVLQLPSADEWYRVTSAILDYLTDSLERTNDNAWSARDTTP